MRSLITLFIILPVLANCQNSKAINKYNDGVENCNRENYRAAIEDFSKAINIYASYYEAYFNRGLAKSILKEYTGAIADFDRALSIKTKAIVYYHRGFAKYHLNKFEEAIEDLDEYISYEGIDYEENAQALVGDAYLELERYNESMQAYVRVLDLNSKNDAAYFGIGMARYMRKEYFDAIQEYNEAIKINSKNAVYYFFRGWAKNDQKDYREAISDFNTAIRIEPDNADYYYARGTAKINAGYITHMSVGTTGGCDDLLKAKELGSKDADKQIKEHCKDN